MDTRFEKCQILGEQLADEALQYIASQIDTHEFNDEAAKVVVFNPINIHQRELVTATVGFPEDSDICNLIIEDDEACQSV
jgi:hypothetical protein